VRVRFGSVATGGGAPPRRPSLGYPGGLLSSVAGHGEQRRPEPPWTASLGFARSLALPLLVWALAAIPAWLAAVLRHNDELDYARRSVRAGLQATGADLSRDLFGALHLTQGIASVISADGDISPERYRALAGDLLQRSVVLRNVALAPNNVVTEVFPERGNERAKGLAYSSVPAQWPAVARMMAEGRIVVAGPVSLVQGGVGVIGRTPVYVADPHGEPGARRYWGLVSTVVDFAALVAPVQEHVRAAHLRVALRGRDGTGDRGEPFWGDAAVFLDDPVTVDVPLPSGSWQLAGLPDAGWPVFRPLSSGYFWGGNALAFALAALVLVLQRARLARRIEMTARRLTEADLARANRALWLKDLALASSASGVLIVDHDGRVSYANPAMARLCGRPAAELAGLGLEDAFAGHPEAASWLTHPPGPLPLELELARPGSTPVFLHVTGHPVASETGERVGVMLSCSDVTEQRQLRKELARIQRLEALGLFAAGVAHDFNNLLMAIYAGLDLGAEAQTGQLRERAMALAAFERARELTGRLLSFSKGSTSRRRAVDLRQLLDESISLALSGSSVRCVRRYAESLPGALGDPGQLAQVLSNLLINARQALGDHGTITVSAVERVEPGGGLLAAGHYVCVGVSDDGPGIPEDVLPRVFEPYFTTKAQGTGLGLATSQAIALEHGGRLTVASQPGAGATFELVIPAAADVAARETAPRPAAAPAPSKRLLVMDDDPAIRTLLERSLGRAGFVVAVAEHGEAALASVAKVCREGAGFDLALLDLTIPGGEGGAEVLPRLRALQPDLVAVAMTGYAEESVKDRLLAEGFVRVLAKPFLMHELLSTISAVLVAE
jgi:signal transduction histidine kinase/CheY-like chemotaxis protein